MELEQRVKALEYEIKILKNEIQQTLAQVQGHALVHYEPGTNAPPTPSDPVVKKVSLSEIRKNRREGVDEAEQENAAPIAAWVTANVARLGTRRVSQLLEAFAGKRILPRALHKTAAQIVAQTNESGPPKPSLTQALDAILKLAALLGVKMESEEALALIEETNLG